MFLSITRTIDLAYTLEVNARFFGLRLTFFLICLSAGTIRRNDTPRQEGVFSARQLVPASGAIQNRTIVERPSGRMTRGAAIEVLGIPAS